MSLIALFGLRCFYVNLCRTILVLSTRALRIFTEINPAGSRVIHNLKHHFQLIFTLRLQNGNQGILLKQMKTENVENPMDL